MGNVLDGCGVVCVSLKACRKDPYRKQEKNALKCKQFAYVPKIDNGQNCQHFSLISAGQGKTDLFWQCSVVSSCRFRQSAKKSFKTLRG